MTFMLRSSSLPKGPKPYTILFYLFFKIFAVMPAVYFSVRR